MSRLYGISDEGTATVPTFNIGKLLEDALSSNVKATPQSAGRELAVSEFYESEMFSQASQFKNEIQGLIKQATPTKAQIAKEISDIDWRLRANRYSALSSYLLAQAGVPGALQLSAEADKEHATLSYLKNKAANNPAEYIAYKVADFTNKLTPYIQSRGAWLGTFQLNKANALSAFSQANSINAQIKAGGSDSSVLSNADAQIIKTLLTQGKDKEASEYLKQRFVDLSGDSNMFSQSNFNKK